MKPSEKGWLKAFLQLNPTLEERQKLIQKIDNQDKFVYATSQPTGIMYGYPTKIPVFGEKNIEECDSKDKMKILLFDYQRIPKEF